jgi:hypothetical protein
MVVQKAMLEGLQRFLNSMGFQSLDRAKRFSSRGSVLEVDCVEPDHLYSARVPGERVYEVQRPNGIPANTATSTVCITSALRRSLGNNRQEYTQVTRVHAR